MLVNWAGNGSIFCWQLFIEFPVSLLFCVSSDVNSPDSIEEREEKSFCVVQFDDTMSYISTIDPIALS